MILTEPAQLSGNGQQVYLTGDRLVIRHIIQRIDLTIYKDILKLPDDVGIMLKTNCKFEEGTEKYLNNLLTSPKIYLNKMSFELFIKAYFKGNDLVINKWIRYGNHMREVNGN